MQICIYISESTSRAILCRLLRILIISRTCVHHHSPLKHRCQALTVLSQGLLSRDNIQRREASVAEAFLQQVGMHLAQDHMLAALLQHMSESAVLDFILVVNGL